MAKKRKQKSVNATKALEFSGSEWVRSSDSASHRNDYTASDYSFATAYAIVSSIRTCVDIYADMIEMMPYNIILNTGYDVENDKIIGSSSDVKPRTAIQAALRRYRKQYNINLIRRMVYAVMLYDVSFTELIRDEYKQASDLRWLNPLGVTLVERGGEITGYQYFWNSDNDKTYFNLNEMAYDHGFNPFDDNSGMSIVLSVISDLNIESNMKAYLKDVFANNSRPGLIASITDPQYASNEFILKELKRSFEDYLKGQGNQNKSLISPIPLDVQTFDMPELDRNVSVMDSVRTQVFSAFGVPMSIVGDTGSTRYKESLDARATFVQSKLKPLLLRIQDHFNDVIMLFFDPYQNTRFEFDTSAYDLLTELDQQKATMLLQDMSAGLITIGYAQEKRGYPVDNMLKDWVMVEGVPVPKTVLPDIYKAKFGIQDYIEAPAPPAQLPMPQAPTLSLDSGNVLQGVSVSSALQPDIDLSENLSGDSKSHEHTHNHEIPYKALFDNVDGLYQDELVIKSLQSKELEAWFAYEKARINKANKRPFVAKVLEPYLYYRVIDRLNEGLPLHKAIVRVWEDETIKTAVSYRQRARAIARQVFEGKLGMSVAITQFEDLIAREFESAFFKGLARGGISRTDASEDQLALLARETLSEQSNVYDLIDTISQISRDGGTQSSLEPVRNRIERWVARIDGIEQLGYVSAKGDRKMAWSFSPEKEHCSDCQYLNGKVYRASTWQKMNIYPKSSRLECFGIYCGCSLVETDAPLTKGRPSRWS